MNILKSTEERRTYIVPRMVSIKLDNEISLSLESNVAPGDPEASLRVPEYFTNDPFKTNVG